MSGKLLLMFVVFCFANVSGLAQDVQKKSVPSELALKITFFKGKPAAYHSIAEASAKPSGVWFAMFEKIPNWQSPSVDALPVRAVNILTQFEGNAVRINVSVFTGHKSFEKDEFVADYLLGENDRVQVKDLSKFGVVPFEIAVVRVTPAVVAVPSIVNKTISLEVASIEPNYSTLPSYKVKLLNNSSKAVSAFAYQTLLNGRPGVSSLPQALEGTVLIKPGDTYERTVSSSIRPERTADGKIPATAQNETFIIGSVIFEDGTFEGEIGNAQNFLGFTLGRKSQLKQIVPLLEKASEEDFKNGELSRQISNLGIVIEEDDFNESLRTLSALSDQSKAIFRRSAELTSRDVKKMILDELKTVEANQNKVEAATIQTWITAIKEKYKNWLARLS